MSRRGQTRFVCIGIPLCCALQTGVPAAARFLRTSIKADTKSLVDFPDEVVVTETESEKGTIVELRVAQSDMGKVIGKQGRIAKAIRSVVKAAASKEDKKVLVEIMQ